MHFLCSLVNKLSPVNEIPPFATLTLYRFIRSRDNARILETTDVGELNKLVQEGFEYDPIAEGYQIIINDIIYSVSNICFFPSATIRDAEQTNELVGQRFPYSVLAIIYMDDGI